ncbi:MAG: PadR family transcriptional regulator [Longimicrobiales bacterium]
MAKLRGAGNAAGALTPLTYEILVALADAPRHGYGIIREIEERSGTGPSTGALYLALQRLEAEGLIGEAARRPKANEDARRRYYRLTAAGRRAAEAETRRLEALVRVAREKRLSPGAGRALGGEAARG